MTNWEVFRDQALVQIRDKALLINTPLSLTFFSYNAPTGADVATVTGPITFDQHGHGFGVGDPVRVATSGLWTKAFASATGANIATHLVSGVDGDSFSVLVSGMIKITAHGFGNIGDELYLGTTPGSLATSPPPDVLTQRVARILSANIIEMLPWGGVSEMPRVTFLTPNYPSAYTRAETGGVMVISQGGYYQWTHPGSSLAKAIISVMCQPPRQVFRLEKVEVVANATSTDSDKAVVAVSVRDPADAPIATNSLTPTLPNTDRVLVLDTSSYTITPNKRLTIDITLESSSDQTVGVSTITLTWTKRCGVVQ
jgi:hypothetical protein